MGVRPLAGRPAWGSLPDEGEGQPISTLSHRIGCESRPSAGRVSASPPVAAFLTISAGALALSRSSCFLSERHPNVGARRGASPGRCWRTT